MQESNVNFDNPSLLQMSGVRKRFGATIALDGVDLEVGAGKVHAIIGENGAGKSTLMKILSGTIRPDSGSLMYRSSSRYPSTPLEARSWGIAHVHQELSLCSHLSVAENIFLGLEPSTAGWIQRRKLYKDTSEILALLDHAAIAPHRRVADLTIADRQIVEIARALAQQASLILMDEPTSSLQDADVERFFGFMRHLTAHGTSFIYISHFLEEVRRIADTYTVLRDGRTVLSGQLNEVSDGQLVTAMVGRAVDDEKTFRSMGAATAADCVLSVRSLAAQPAVRNASFDLNRGEILGIAGLIGSGRTDLLRALFGLQSANAGTIKLAGKLLPLKATPESRIKSGIGYLSEDRKGEGVALSLPVVDNITLTNAASFSRAGWINLVRQREQAARWVHQVKIKTASVNAPVSSLSGGNQQKVAFARLLHQGCTVLLLDEPTRGVDIASKMQIYELIAALARAGKAILMVSSYLPELFSICNRLAVMRRGVLSETRPIEEWTPASVLHEAIGTGQEGFNH